MRAIKFRAWHLEDKKMLEQTEFWDIEWRYLVSAKHLILLQFTGLLDKNGKQIYEGDIVIDNPEDGSWVIAWHTEGAMFDLKHGNVWSPFAHKDCEVIGNVWESPELLEKK